MLASPIKMLVGSCQFVFLVLSTVFSVIMLVSGRLQKTSDMEGIDSLMEGKIPFSNGHTSNSSTKDTVKRSASNIDIKPSKKKKSVKNSKEKKNVDE